MPELYPYNPSWLSNRPVAHRGLHGPGVPENSLAAFKAAAAAGYAIELDVHLSSDGKLVVIHDPNTARTTRRRLVVADTPAAELVRLQLQGTSQRLPLLAEVLKTVRGHVPLLIEVKHQNRPRHIGPAVVRELAAYSGEVAVASFDPRTVTWFRFHAPNLPRGQIASSLPDEPRPRWMKWLLRCMLLNPLSRPQFIAYDARDLPSRMLSFWRYALRVPVLVWVVKSQHYLKVADRDDCNIIFERLRPPVARRP